MILCFAVARVRDSLTWDEKLRVQCNCVAGCCFGCYFLRLVQDVLFHARFQRTLRNCQRLLTHNQSFRSNRVAGGQLLWTWVQTNCLQSSTSREFSSSRVLLNYFLQDLKQFTCMFSVVTVWATAVVHYPMLPTSEILEYYSVVSYNCW